MAVQVVFFGSSDYSLPVLQKLIDQNLVSLVVTTPDKPVGRHLKLTPNPVKVLAQKHNIPVITSLLSPLLSLGEENKRGEVVGLIAAFGRIIPQSILDTFNDQIYNIHPSLLPKYRGPSPLQQQILDGVTDTGVTLIKIDALMDHGPIVAQEKDIILNTDTPRTLGKRLFEKGTDLFIKLLSNNSPLLFPSLRLREGLGVSYIPQDDSAASYTHKLTRQDGFVPWTEINSSLDRKFRAYHPWPGLWTLDPQGRRLKLS